MTSYKPRLNIDALVFSSYDVLIDVSLSYREVVRETVQLYLERAIGLPSSKEQLLDPMEVAILQKVGHFTNYWDLTSAFILYFVEMLPAVAPPTFPTEFHVPAMLAYLQLAGGHLRVSLDSLREKKDVGQFAKDVSAAGGGLEGAHRALAKENRHLLISSGDLTKTNIVGRIFQELYLGADLFERVYGQQAIVIQSTGYAEHESLVIDRDVLAQISQHLPLAVVSDRPRSEIERSLRARQVDQFFVSIVSLDETRQAKAKPIPDPWPLLEAISLLKSPPANSAYIGANVGDIHAAKAANRIKPFAAIGCLAGAHDKDSLRAEFEQYKANMILGHPNHLKELIVG